jgi:hypothetical protein
MTLGFLAIRMSNPDTAREHANRALQLDESNGGAKRLLQKLEAQETDG